MQADRQTDYEIAVPSDLSGEALAGFETELTAATGESISCVALDCSRLRHVTSSHIAVLWEARRTCLEAEIDVRLEAPPPGLIRILRLLDLDEFFLGEDGGEVLSPDAPDAQITGSPALSFTDELEPNDAAANAVIHRFQAYLAHLGVSETSKFEFRTLLYEVLNNIISHGGLGAGNAIAVTAVCSGSRIILKCVDSGVPFDPVCHPGPHDLISMARHRKPRGLGLTMIRKLANTISYARSSAGQNVLTLEKNLE